jgi:hypothetical protein
MSNTNSLRAIFVKFHIVCYALFFALPLFARAGNTGTSVSLNPEFGAYFVGKGNKSTPLPTFEQVKDKLPSPILDAHPDWIRMYWRCWQLSFAHLMTPPPQCPFISNWQGQGNGFLNRLFQWDSCFMVMYGRYGNAQFPAVESLDNFYSRQRPDGYICREFSVADGSELQFGAHGGYHDPDGWKNSVNPPLFAWAECESFK